MNTEQGTILAAAAAALGAALNQAIQWVRGRKGDAANTGLAVDERWQKYADNLEERLGHLEQRLDAVEQELERERSRAKRLTDELERYKDLAKSLARHVLRLRDALNRATGNAPPIPPDIEEALTVIDL